jgi:VanZ family protein
LSQVRYATRVTSRRLPAVLLGLYVVFVVYGSLFPFHFEYDPDALAHILHAFPRRLSPADVLENLILGAPLGVLMTWSGVAGGTLAVRVVSVTVTVAVLSALLELGQAFVPGRFSSVLDVVAQVVGSLAGLLVAHRALARARCAQWPSLSIERHERPLIVGLLAVAAVLAADALYPFMVSLHPSDVWRSVQGGLWRPRGLYAQAFWLDVLVEKVLAYAAVGALARSLLGGRAPGAASLLAWGVATGFAVVLESAKPFIVGGVPSVDGVLRAALGGLAGVTVLASLVRAPLVRVHMRGWLVFCAIALLVYEELTPFSLITGASDLPDRIAHVEWVPFLFYFGADLPSALFDLGKKVVLGAALGAAMRYATPRPRLVLVLAGAALLEAMQIVQPVHTPSVTDVLVLYVAALVGASLVGRNEAA